MGRVIERAGVSTRKVGLLAFNGDAMCFIHVLLNAVDMNDRGYEVKIIVEGSATRLIPELAKEDNPMHRLYEKAKGLDLIDGSCKACSTNNGCLGRSQGRGFKALGRNVRTSQHGPV